MDLHEQIRVITDVLEDKKASDITVLDIKGLSIMADYFVIGSGSNKNQIGAIIDAIEEKMLKVCGIFPKHIEGTKDSGWILLDYQDIIVHIFDIESRSFYDLERIWGDAKTLSLE